LVTILFLAVLVSLDWTGFFHSNNQTNNNLTPASPPFDYNLSVPKLDSTVIQGNVATINILITYTQGSPEKVLLNATGIPKEANYSFTQIEGVPTNNSSFNSILTILITEFVPSDQYNITITSTATNGKTNSSNNDLTVINSKISDSGTVTTNKGIIPTQIHFEQMSVSGSLTGKVYSSAIVSGTYSVVLPNKEFFAVSVNWENPDGTSGIHYFIQPYGTNAGVGVNSITCPFEWETA
jgi:hypothetical protein